MSTSDFKASGYYVSHHCGLWNQIQEKFPGECVLITAVFAYGNKFELSLKWCAKNAAFGVY